MSIRPPEDSTALSQPETVNLNGLEKATITFEPERSNTDLALYCLAASKRADTTYKIKIDDATRWGPARIPPSDIDDKAVVWMPPEEVRRSVTVEVTNVRENSGTRTYHVLPLGWEMQ